MMGFERCVTNNSSLIMIHFIIHIYTHRYNKYLKNLVRNAKNPCVTLANSVAIDTAAAYLELYPLIKYDVNKSIHHNCVLQRQVGKIV